MAEKNDTAHIRDLKPDPTNARRHNARNIGTIVDSLHEVGAARSVVVDEDLKILAGHGTIDGAAEAGITRVKIVDADGEEIVAVRRRGLTPEQKKRLAYFDNRANELSDWDPAQLALDVSAGLSLDGLFYENELADILAGVETNGDVLSPEDFPSYGEDIETEYRCPSCAYEWSGKPK